MSTVSPPSSVRGNRRFQVELPGGGFIEVRNQGEVDFWNELRDRYLDDYAIVKANDRVLVGALLSQSLEMYRAQLDLQDPKKAAQAVARISKASEQIRELEKALGIDKKAREAGGQHTVVDYITRLKRAAHAMGVRISERVLEYEDFNNELRWRLRLLRNGDAEDRKHHGITRDSILEFCERRLAEIEERDKEWAREKGAIFVGKL
jgi:hypothetical protein